MRSPLLAFLILTIVLTCPLAAFENGEVYLDTRTDLWVYRADWSYAVGGGAFPLIDKFVPFAGPGHFLAPAPNRIVFHDGRAVSAWDGVLRLFNEPGKGYDDLFTADTELTEIAPGRAGRYLVAERWNDRQLGAKLIEFDLRGRVAEYRFPDVIVGDRALGAMHIELLADQCTVLYTLGSDDPAGNRVRRFNICTNEAQTDFASLVAGQYAGAIRQLPNGEVLVANGDAVLRFTPQGSLVRSYQVAQVTHLALSADGRSFWTAGVDLDHADLRAFDADGSSRAITIGNPGMQSLTVPVDVSDLVVVGEWRAAVTQRARAFRRQ